MHYHCLAIKQHWHMPDTDTSAEVYELSWCHIRRQPLSCFVLPLMYRSNNTLRQLHINSITGGWDGQSSLHLQWRRNKGEHTNEGMVTHSHLLDENRLKIIQAFLNVTDMSRYCKFWMPFNPGNILKLLHYCCHYWPTLWSSLCSYTHRSLNIVVYRHATWAEWYWKAGK